jgi:hypothetical protein
MTPASYHELHGVWRFVGCYSVEDDQLWGVVQSLRPAANTLAALTSIRRARLEVRDDHQTAGRLERVGLG